MECTWELGKVDHANFELWLLANEDNSGLRTMVLNVIDSADEYARRNHFNAARLYGVHTRMAATMALNLMMSRKMFQKESPDMASKLKDCGKGFYLPFVKAVLPEGIAVETEKQTTTLSGRANQRSTEKNAPQMTGVSPTVENPSSNLPGMDEIALKERSTLSVRDRFLAWLKEQNYSSNDIGPIVQAIEWSEKLAVERQAGAERFFEARDLSDAVSTFSALLSVHSFVEMDKKSKGLCSQSIRLLIDMLRQEQGRTASPQGKTPSSTEKPNNAPRKAQSATNDAPAKPLRTSRPEPPSDKPARMKTPPKPIPQADADLYDLLERENIRYIDIRLYSGKLWIIGGMEHASFILKANKLGYEFKYDPNGSKKSIGKIGWYLTGVPVQKTVVEPETATVRDVQNGSKKPDVVPPTAVSIAPQDPQRPEPKLKPEPAVMPLEPALAELLADSKYLPLRKALQDQGIVELKVFKAIDLWQFMDRQGLYADSKRREIFKALTLDKKALDEPSDGHSAAYTLMTTKNTYSGNKPSEALLHYCNWVALDRPQEFRGLIGRRYNDTGKYVLYPQKTYKSMLELFAAPAYIDATLSREEALDYAKWICRQCGSDDIPERLEDGADRAKKLKEKETKPDAPSSSNGAKLVWTTNLSQDCDFSFCNIEYMEIEGEHFKAPRTCAVAYQLGLNWLYRNRFKAFTEAFDRCYNGESGSCMLANGRTVNIQFSANTLMGKLKDMVVACGVPADHVIIGYTGGRQFTKPSEPVERDAPVRPVHLQTNGAKAQGPLQPAGPESQSAKDRREEKPAAGKKPAAGEKSVAGEKPATGETPLSKNPELNDSAIEYIAINGERNDDVDSWKEAYVWGLNWLLREYPEAAARAIRIFVGTYQNANNTFMLHNGMMVKINGQPTSILKNLKRVAEECGMNPEAVVVGYRPTEASADGAGSDRPVELPQAAQPIEQGTYKINMSDRRNFAFCTPVNVSLGQEKLEQVKNWRQAYLWLLNRLAARHPRKFKSALTAAFKGAGQLRSPATLNNGSQVETNLSASDLMWKAARVAEGCGVDPAGIVITYSREKQATQITFDDMRSGNGVPILPEPEGLRVVELTHMQDFSNSDIYYLEMDGDRFTRPRNWADAFKEGMTWLLRRYPKAFKRVPEAFDTGETVCTFENGARLKIYYNPTWLMKKLKASAEICGLSPSRIAVGYIPPQDSAWVVDLGQDFDLTHTAVRFLEMDGDRFNTPKTWVEAFQWGMNWLQRRYPWMFRYTLSLFGSGRGKCVLKDGTTIPVLYERTWLMKKLKAAAEMCGLTGDRIVVGYVKEGIQDAPKTALEQIFDKHEPESASAPSSTPEPGLLQPPVESVTPDCPAGQGSQEKPGQGELALTTEEHLSGGIEPVDQDDCQTQTPSYAGENGINSSVEAGESLR